MKRAITTIAAALLLAVAVGAYAELGGSTGGVTAPRAEHKRSAVRIKGHVTALYPGVPAILHARARNRAPRPVRLMRVKARVRSGAPGCGRRYLRTKRIHPRRIISPHRKRRLPIKVRLRASAPDACQGVRFRLHYRTRVVPIGRWP
jgi:hypothetical protein